MRRLIPLLCAAACIGGLMFLVAGPSRSGAAGPADWFRATAFAAEPDDRPADLRADDESAAREDGFEDEEEDEDGDRRGRRGGPRHRPGPPPGPGGRHEHHGHYGHHGHHGPRMHPGPQGPGYGHGYGPPPGPPGPPPGPPPGHELMRAVLRRFAEISDRLGAIEQKLGIERPDREPRRRDGDEPRPPRAEAERGGRPFDRLDLPPEMRRMMEERMREGRQRMEEARKRFREMEERVKSLEAEVERLKAGR